MAMDTKVIVWAACIQRYVFLQPPPLLHRDNLDVAGRWDNWDCSSVSVTVTSQVTHIVPFAHGISASWACRFPSDINKPDIFLTAEILAVDIVRQIRLSCLGFDVEQIGQGVMTVREALWRRSTDRTLVRFANIGIKRKTDNVIRA